MTNKIEQRRKKILKKGFFITFDKIIKIGDKNIVHEWLKKGLNSYQTMPYITPNYFYYFQNGNHNYSFHSIKIINNISRFKKTPIYTEEQFKSLIFCINENDI